MKRVCAATVALLIGLLTAGGSAQSQSAALPSVDQILDKYVTALGGRAAMEKITSRVSKGTVEIAEAGLSGTITISEKAPGKSLAAFELPGMGMVREGTDGTIAWSEDPQTGLRDKAGAELADALRGSTFNAELKMKSLYKTMAVTGTERVGTRNAYAVLATPAEGAVNRLYFDTETGLLVRQASTRDTPQGPIDVDVFLEDVRDVEGIKQPFTVRQVTSMFSLVVHLTEIKYNVALDDAIFKRPGEPVVAR